MQDRDLDQVMAKWVDDEMASAPKLRPTAEMYERVVSLGRRRSLGALFARRPVWATSLAVVVVLALAFALVQVSPLVLLGGGQQVAQVPQRSAFEVQKGQTRGTLPPKGKGPREETAPLQQLEFQVRGADSSAVRVVNVLSPYARPVALTAEDSYRLVIEPASAQHVYVYQRSPAGALTQLYPNETYSPQQNPLRAAETVYLPAEPNGFYLKGEGGLFRLYIIAAEEPEVELERLYAAYNRRGIRLDRRESLALLQERLDAIAGARMGEPGGWMFEFEVQ